MGRVKRANKNGSGGQRLANRNLLTFWAEGLLGREEVPHSIALV